ncbi:hypothetical protein HDU76_007513 [Blyttiomyces sp. JEL0837]|nr:hypothetical protein HDU76_007513 [Blyttiomyces sp. JEL0837]
MNDSDDPVPILMTVWLRDLDPDVQRSRFLHLSAFQNRSSTVTTNQHEVYSDQGLGRSGSRFTSYEIQPGLQPSRYEQTLRETAPTSNTNLETYMQRVYGIYDTWSHEYVMEWARLKRLDPAVVEIMKNYHIDGPLLSTLDVHSLKEKCGVDDFRLRAKFIQSVEFLKDSSQSLRNQSTGNEDGDGDNLPQYEGSANQ